MTVKKDKHLEMPFNSVQLNIVIVVDVQKAHRLQTLEGCMYTMDNNINSNGQGTDHLQTVCKQGQVLNWIIYSMDFEKRIDGTFPPYVRINNIVFLSEGKEDVIDIKVVSDLKVYGSPDKIRSKYTPVYYYWAGTILHDLPAGVYFYRLILELESEDSKNPTYLECDSLSLRVISI